MKIVIISKKAAKLDAVIPVALSVYDAPQLMGNNVIQAELASNKSDVITEAAKAVSPETARISPTPAPALIATNPKTAAKPKN